MPTNTTDAINPDHYKQLDPEPITVIERWDLGFCLGNAVKYIARAGKKPGADRTEDLKKARWYVERAIAEPVMVVVYSDAYADDSPRSRQLKAHEIVAAAVGTAAPAAAAPEADLAADLEAAQRDAAQWKICARVLAERVRELTGGPRAEKSNPEIDRALELLKGSCTEGGEASDKDTAIRMAVMKAFDLVLAIAQVELIRRLPWRRVDIQRVIKQLVTEGVLKFDQHGVLSLAEVSGG